MTPGQQQRVLRFWILPTEHVLGWAIAQNARGERDSIGAGYIFLAQALHVVPVAANALGLVLETLDNAIWQ